MMRDEKPGGHGDRAGAVGLLDSALWDSQAASSRTSHYGVFSRSALVPAMRHPRVAVYASGGHYRDDQLASLKAEIARAIDLRPHGVQDQGHERHWRKTSRRI